jgi:hypothetical protein
MPEVTVNYTENLPSTDETYKTRRFSIEIRQQIPENIDISPIADRLFFVAKANVQAQVSKAAADIALHDMPNGQPVPQPQQSVPSRPATPPAPSNVPKPVSTKQINFLFRLGKEAGLSDEQVRALPMQYYQKAMLHDLTSQEASALIDTLGEKKKAA